MPLSPKSIHDQRVRPPNRREASAKNDGIVRGEYPIITQTAYQSVLRVPEKDMTKEMRQLCMARIRLGQALQATDQACHAYNPKLSARKPDVYNRLRRIYDKLEKELLVFPLEIRK